MTLTKHDQEVLVKLKGVDWISQHQLQTSRQTMNKLVKANLVERKIVNGAVRYLPESGARYRLKKTQGVIN